MSTRHVIVQKIGIDAGHRVYGHEGKCKALHGHRYEFEFFAQPNQGLDSLGRVIDFGAIKEIIGTWLLNYWDHGVLLWHADDLAQWFTKPQVEVRRENDGDPGIITTLLVDSPFFGQKHFILPTNPTAENLTAYMLYKSSQLLVDTNVEVFKVGVYETPNCYAYTERMYG